MSTRTRTDGSVSSIVNAIVSTVLMLQDHQNNAKDAANDLALKNEKKEPALSGNSRKYAELTLKTALDGIESATNTLFGLHRKMIENEKSGIDKMIRDVVEAHKDHLSVTNKVAFSKLYPETATVVELKGSQK